MTAAFTLTSSGPPAPCGFPNCVLASFHEGEHELKRDKRFEFPGELPVEARSSGGARQFICCECGRQFIIYGERIPGEKRLCDSQACLLANAIRDAAPIFLMCACPQRPYPHELEIHTYLRREAYDRTRRYLWPWSLALAERLEPSTEKENMNG